MKEIEKRARVTVAYGGLRNMHLACKADPQGAMSRKNMFLAPAELPEGMTEKALTKAMMTKAWQREFLRKMVEAKMLHKSMLDGQDAYQPFDLVVIKDLLDQHDNGGLRLFQFLFPSDAGTPKELRGEENLPPPGTDVELESAEARGGEEDLAPDAEEIGFRTLQALSSNMRVLSEAVQSIDTKLNKVLEVDDEQSQVESELIPYMRNRSKEQEALLTSIKDMLAVHIKEQEKERTRAQDWDQAMHTNIVAIHTMVRALPGVQKVMEVLSNHLRLHKASDLADRAITAFKERVENLGAAEDLMLRISEVSDEERRQHEQGS